MTAGEFLEALGAVGWSQREIARRVGIHPNTANDWAKGRSAVPKWVGSYLGLVRDVKGLASRLEKGAE